MCSSYHNSREKFILLVTEEKKHFSLLFWEGASQFHFMMPKNISCMWQKNVIVACGNIFTRILKVSRKDCLGYGGRIMNVTYCHLFSTRLICFKCRYIWDHFMGNRWGNSGNSVRLNFCGLENHCRWWLQPWN